MSDSIEQEVQHKFSVLEDFGKTQPQGADFIGAIKGVVQAAVASHKASTLKKVVRELDTLAEEFFVTDSAQHYRNRYWSKAGGSAETLVEENVRQALRERRIQGEDQMRAILVYLDQIATGLRKNFLDEQDTERLKVFARRFEIDRSR